MKSLIVAPAFLIGFAGVAAEDVSLESVLELARPVFDAVMAGQYPLAAALALVLLVAVARKWLAPRVPFFGSDAGGALLALAGSFGGAVATALLAGATLSWSVAWTALGVAFTAAGGYSLVKRLGGALLARIPLPNWLKTLLDSALWIFSSPVERAEAAGAAAVAEKPAGGAGPTGELP